MAALFESGTFTTIPDLLNKIDAYLVNVVGYTRNMAPTVDNVFGTGSRAHYQRTNTDGRQIFVNLKALTALLNSGTIIPDGISANISDGFNASVQWHLQPGGPVMRGVGLSGNASFVSSRVIAGDVTAKPYDFYSDGYSCVLLYATGATVASWCTPKYYYQHGLMFGFLEDTGCGTGFAAAGGTAGTFMYGKQTANNGSSYNGLREDQDLHIGCITAQSYSSVMRNPFHARIKSGTFDGYTSGSMNWYNAGSSSRFAGFTTALYKSDSGNRGWCLDYLAQPDICAGCNYDGYGIISYDINDNSNGNGYFPIEWVAHNSQFSPMTGKFFCYQPTWFSRDEATLRWFPVGRFPLVYQQRTDTTNILPNPGSITVAGQAYDVRGPLWIKKITV